MEDAKLPRLIDLFGPQTGVVGGGPEITGLTADSRKVRPGMVFAALPGVKVDGRTFIPQAVAAGASVILAPLGTPQPKGDVVLVTDATPRRTFAQAAAAFYGAQPPTMVAVTGTNGKTSTANFVRQLWMQLGYSSAALGTLGVIAEGWPRENTLTTPDPVELHATLAALALSGVTHACMEASSHGLDQDRLDGVTLQAAAFTNLTRDHLDYHPDMEAYWAAKRRLFTELLPRGGAIVANAETPEAAELAQIATERELRFLDYGYGATALALIEATPTPAGQRLRLRVMGVETTVDLSLAGAFQASNALAALGLVLACGAEPEAALQALSRLEGVPGRLEKVAQTAEGAPIYVDYAHTPDALTIVLQALRPHVLGRLLVVFGCGGDRDPGKRPQMGRIAAELADWTLVTDDNPRSEQPAAIRQAILSGMSGIPAFWVEIGDRAQAIQAAIGELNAGDILVIAGKGHETGQIIGGTVIPFDDAAVARAAVGGCS